MRVLPSLMSITTQQKDFLLSFLFGIALLPIFYLIARITNPRGAPDGGFPGFIVIFFGSIASIFILGQKVSHSSLFSATFCKAQRVPRTTHRKLWVFGNKTIGSLYIERVFAGSWLADKQS